MLKEERAYVETKGWPVHGGGLGRLIRDYDWSSHALGAPSRWEPELRTAVDLMLPAGVQMVLFWGEDFRAFYNDAYAPTIGEKHPHALGQPAKHYWGELWDDLCPLLENVRTTGETFTARDHPFRIDRQGFIEETFFDVSYSALRQGGGKVGGVMCIVNETTELVRALEHLSLAQEAGGAGVFERFSDTNELVVSDGYRSLYGISPGQPVTTAELIGQQHPDDRSLASPEREAAGMEPLPYIEYRIHRADTGEERWLSRRGGAVRPRGGRPRFVGVTVDITERKRAEEQLIRLNETLEARVAAATRERDQAWRLSQDLIVVIETDGTLRAVNPAWRPILGYDPASLVGTNYQALVHPDDFAESVQALNAAADQPVANFRNRLRHTDGSFRWISWHGAPDEGGLVFVTGRDVTEEIDAANALARAEEQLRQAQKMEAVGQLTGGIAHDFNNLLQGITGSLDLMKRRIAEGRTKDLDRFLNGAMTSAERAAALTHRLLAFSRRQPLDPRPVKVNGLVAGMEDLLRRTLGANIELELVLAGGLWMTLCDANQLENALLNLAINARDAMADKGGRLTIETSNTHLDNAYAARDRDVRPGQYVCICVSDTGEGMNAEVMARAFDPFFTTKPMGKGTGLGLSMIYGFARQSEGSIKLYSEQGNGTTAKLYLPRYRGPDPDKAAAEVEDTDAAYDGVSVLVVEDEPIVRSLIVEVLKELGYRAIEAADGLEGLQILRGDRRVDLLVTDIGLPGLNGRQMVEGARLTRPGLKVLFMTGYAENAALASGFLAPGMEMITKPFAMDSLARRIAELLRKP